MFKLLPDDIIQSILRKLKPSSIANIYWTYRDDNVFVNRFLNIIQASDFDLYEINKYIFEMERKEELSYDEEQDQWESMYEDPDEPVVWDNDDTSFENLMEDYDFEEFINESRTLRDEYRFWISLIRVNVGLLVFF